jgi:NAD(P)-dependent dehydrogenase (short-subunit alcohol dehydrogenase family)
MKRIALVTGANKGIGLEICRQLAQKGFHVLLGSRDEARGRKAAAMLVQNGAEVEAVVVDVAAPATFETARKLIEDRFGRLDVLINNAGIGEQEDWQSTAENVPIADVHALGYDASKTALNAFTVHLAKVFRGSAIKVNSAHPGSVKTDMNPTGDLTVEEGAQTAVGLATLADDGPSGGFFHRGKRLPW